MTAAEIDAMPAGREMDALVAEKVMGFVVMRHRDVDGQHIEHGPDEWMRGPDGEAPRYAYMVPVDHYSTDIAAAWEVVEKLKPDDWAFRVEVLDDGDWWASFSATAESWAGTVPLAICRAALKAALTA
jgi:hypothetical protein